MVDNLKQKLTKSVELADKVTNTPDEQISFKQECGEQKSETKKLSALIWHAATMSSELYIDDSQSCIIFRVFLNKFLV